MQFSQPFNEPTTGTRPQPPLPRYFNQTFESVAARRVEGNLGTPERSEVAPVREVLREETTVVEECAYVFARLDLHTESNFFAGFSGELSEGGVFIISYQPLRVGQRVEVEMCLAGQFVSVFGRVVWRRVPHHGRLDLAPGAGIVLEGLDPALRARIGQFMQRREPWFVDTEVLPLGLPEAGETGVAPRSQAALAVDDNAPVVNETVAAVSEAVAAPREASASQGKVRRPGRKQRRGRGRRNSKG